LGVFENRALKRIFETKMEDMGRWWKKLHNRAPRNMSFSTHIISIIKSIRCKTRVKIAINDNIIEQVTDFNP